MMSEHKYYNFKQGVTAYPKLLTMEEIEKINPDTNKDYYMSIFRYNDKHKNVYPTSGKDKNGKVVPSVKGSEFHDVVTNMLVWDFDSTENPVQAQEDVLKLAQRLQIDHDIDGDDMYVTYSGNKGFHLALNLPKDINQEQFKQATTSLVQSLTTYDPSVCDPPRILRVEHTKNLKTGLYKIPLHIDEVNNLTLDQIKELAKTPRTEFKLKVKPVNLPEDLFKVPEVKKKENKTSVDSKEFNLENFSPKNCAKGWKPYKWALAQGWFESGDRHSALMVVAATCRALGYTKDQAYYICKSALKMQAERTGNNEFGKKELWENIIEKSVYSNTWEGGSYSPATNPWLKKYCDKMGFKELEEKDDAPSVNLDDLIAQFIHYSTNFDQNIIKTGILELDENLILSTSTLNGLLGQPGSGKTTFALEILRNASKNNIPSMFFSLDMGPPLVFSKLAQKETGVGFRDVLQMYKTNFAQRDAVSKLIKENYNKVGFNFRCGSTVENLKTYIQQETELKGIKPKLIIVDYAELVSGPYSDPNANAAIIAHSLKNLATEEEVCVLLLLQTQKHSTPDISDPLLSMKQIKGASAIEQDCSVVLTLWREGYNPNTVNDDKYISFALVKNRFGSLWRGDFSWDGVKGDIGSLSEEQYDDLEAFKKRKKEQRAAEAPKFE